MSDDSSDDEGHSIYIVVKFCINFGDYNYIVSIVIL